MRWLFVIIYLIILYCTLGVARDGVDYLRAQGWLAGTILSAATIFTLAICFLIWKSKIWRSLPRLFAVFLSFSIVGAIAFNLDVWEERAHFIQYSVLALLLGWALASIRHGWGRFFTVALLCSIFGAIDEGIQYLLPNRYFDLRDIWFNSIAGIWGAVLHILLFPHPDREQHLPKS